MTMVNVEEVRRPDSVQSPGTRAAPSPNVAYLKVAAGTPMARTSRFP